MMFTNANVATIHAITIPALRSEIRGGVTMRAISATLSHRKAAAVLGAIGMKAAAGCTNTDQLAVHPMSTTTLFTATSTANRSAARSLVRCGLTGVRIVISPIWAQQPGSRACELGRQQSVEFSTGRRV